MFRFFKNSSALINSSKKKRKNKKKKKSLKNYKDTIMEAIDENFILPVTAFAKNSKMLLQKCTKPNYNDFNNSAIATAMGFALMGFIGFCVKVFFIPINNVILGQ